MLPLRARQETGTGAALVERLAPGFVYAGAEAPVIRDAGAFVRA